MCDNHPEFVTHWLRALPAKFQFGCLDNDTERVRAVTMIDQLTYALSAATGRSSKDVYISSIYF